MVAPLMLQVNLAESFRESALSGETLLLADNVGILLQYAPRVLY